MKRLHILSMLAALALLLCCLLPTKAQAATVATGTCGTNVIWTLDDAGTLTFSGEGAIQDYTYSSSAPWYNQNASITSVVIEAGVTGIGQNAFGSLPAVTTVTIGKDVSSIGNFPSAYCKKLTGIQVDPENQFFSSSGGTLFNKDQTVLLKAPTIISFCTIPNTVTTIGDLAFSGSELITITIPEGVTHIGNSAFNSCPYMSSASIPNSLTYIGDQAFSYCTNLRYNTYGGGSYLGNSTNKYLLLVESNSQSVTSFTVHSATKFIASYAFQYHSKLTSVNIPDGVLSIGSNAFTNCTSLKTVTLPSSLTSIRNYTFNQCSALTTIVIPEGVTSIGGSAFYYCSNLTSVTLSDSLTTIGERAFQYCRSLPELMIPDSVTTIGNLVFYSCGSLQSITIPKSVTSIGTTVFGYCSSLTGIWVDPDNQYYASDAKGVLMDKAQTKLLAVPQKISGHYTIPAGVTKIESSMFSGCKSLTGITIPEGVTDIGYRAFENCSGLKTIVIPDSVKYISSDTLAGCSGLESLTVPFIGSSVKTAADTYQYPLGYFFGTSSYTGGVNTKQSYHGASSSSVTSTNYYIPSSLKSVTVTGGEILYGAFSNCGNLTLIMLPHNITAISEMAFYGCRGITVMEIPETVKSIGQYAFYNCGSLKHVAFGGSQSQWSSVSIGNYNEKLTGVSVFHCETAFEAVDTCTESGLYCSACQAFATQTVKPDGAHAFVDATCTTPKTCTACGVTEGTALGHSGQWIELVPVTCTVDGINARICSVCGETETLSIEAPGHSESAAVTPPTCTEQGYTTKTCSVCGNVAVSDYVAATGHAYSTVTVEPTCTEQGSTTKTCAICGDVTTEYVPAKGHGWSAWIQTAAPSCQAEGSRVRFCNCGIRETETIEKLPHSYVSEVCTGCGRNEYFRMVLTEDTAVNLNLEQDLYVGMNGYDLTGTIVLNGFKVYAMDSTTDGYTCENIGYFTCVDENGNYIVPERVYTVGEKQYMAICTEDRYSFHRFFVGITHMSLTPETVGLGYKSAIFGDEMVFAELAETKAFSFRLQLEGYNPVYRYFGSSELTSGEPITLRIRNYDVENYSEHNLYAQVSLILSDGTVVETEQVSLTFRWLTEQVNANYNDYTAEQLTQFAAMLQAFDIVKKWDIPNLI